MTREKLIAAIRAMPEDEFGDINPLIENLIILEKIQIGMEQSRNGQLTSMKDVLYMFGIKN